MKKHTNASDYKCVVTHCDRTFYRGDKFDLHILVDHDPDEKAACPVSGCSSEPLELALLMVHAQQHRLDDNIVNIRLYYMGYRETIHCPINGCKKLPKSYSFQEHFKSHSTSELRESHDALSNAGYDFSTLEVICPICQESCVDMFAFETHLVVHLVTDDEHYRSILGQADKGPSEFSYARPWVAALWWKYKDSECQFCGEKIYLDNDGYTEHHFSLLKDPDDILPYRLAILRLWPYFGGHPVFDDIRLSPAERVDSDEKWRKHCPNWKRFQS
ncbi:hypothetical protein BDV96DRAFT_145468 [Lophiotrema nucula]|uniref:C2H2-type domain-containing protein n=1 Tax=Lophiotrema nucula TaxID=690887 RepID=A0A6A5Z390_9PLEO|nr:hypothetical protein BDV96DRAFT_145468 [Lophiotrema nucula]